MFSHYIDSTFTYDDTCVSLHNLTLHWLECINFTYIYDDTL